MALGTTIFINIGVAPKNFTIHSNLPCVKPPTILTCILFFSFPSSELYDLEIPHFTKKHPRIGTIKQLGWPPKMCKVFRTRWWMGSYGSPTPKRHVGYSNSKCIGRLNLGKLQWNYKCERYQKNKTTKRTVKGNKKQFTGVKKTLKSSQHLVRIDLTMCCLFWVWKLLTVLQINFVFEEAENQGWFSDVLGQWCFKKEVLISFNTLPSGARVLSKTWRPHFHQSHFPMNFANDFVGL